MAAAANLMVMLFIARSEDTSPQDLVDILPTYTRLTEKACWELETFLLVAINFSTRCKVMPPPSATQCRHISL